MDISVAMATYNGARYLAEQLDSLAQQTHLPAELVICDDRSTDATPDVVEAFARRAPFPIRFEVNTSRLHFADNFLKAAGQCTSAAIAFCDQDDVWRPHKLATVARALNTTGACLVAHNCTHIDASGRPTGHFVQTASDRMLTGADLHPWTFFYGFSCTFDRRLLDLAPADQRPIDLIEPTRSLSHDRWVAFLAATYGTAYVLRESLADYRRHDDNASGWMRRPRGLADSLHVARHGFGYHLLRRLTVAQGLVAVLRGLMADQRRLELVPSRERLTEMLDYWILYADRCAARYHIVEQDRWSGRLGRLFGALGAHAYRKPVDGTMVYREIAEDLVVCALAGRGQHERAKILLGSGRQPETAPV